MKKVIVLGATGNTGVYLVDYLNHTLNKEEYEIIAAGRRKTDFFSRWGIPYYSIDIADKGTLDLLPKENIHAVIFEAGILPASMKGYHPEQYLKVNTMGALNVLGFCRENAVDRIIYTQTIREIGEYINTDVVLKPELPRTFSYKGDHAVYVISKNAAVDLIEHYWQEYGLKRFVFRLPTIYAYGKSDTYYVDGVARKKAYRLFMDKAKKGEPIEMWGDPERAHDVVYVKDLCQMLCKAVTADCEGGIYHVGTGKPISLREQIEGIVEVFAEGRNQRSYRNQENRTRVLIKWISLRRCESWAISHSMTMWIT